MAALLTQSSYVACDYYMYDLSGDWW